MAGEDGVADVELLLVSGAWALGSVVVALGVGAVVARAERPAEPVLAAAAMECAGGARAVPAAAASAAVPAGPVAATAS
ncbi:hypothetical protein [Quadrisphaera sp. KR29]|uniref:hypothetical protein n=1 Tax=Quadrisphaera sp. KR29 TaxID=3461391 RepID=UPI004044062D